MQLTPIIAIHMTAAIGGFTLLPSRYLGNLVFSQWLGLV